jgi:hypothetical protein
MKDDEQIRIRLLGGDLAQRVFKHTAKDETGRFLDVLCVGPQGGCKMCKANARPEFKDVDKRFKPYPTGMKYVKPVYVYGEDKVKLLAGVEVWKQIDAVHSMFGSALDRDIIIKRTKEIRVIYRAQADAPTPFQKTFTPDQIPPVKDYIDWLKENLKQAVFLDEEALASTASSVPATTPAATSGAFTTGAEAAPAAGPVDEKKKLIDDFHALMNQDMDGTAVTQTMAKVTGGRTSKLTDFTVEELKSLIKEYKTLKKL